VNRYIVTGAAGFIGSSVVLRLLEEGHEVVGIDDFSANKGTKAQTIIKDTKRVHEGKYTFINVDITKERDLWRKNAYFRNIDGVFHLAAQARIQPSIKHPLRTFEINMNGTLNILSMMKKFGIVNIVYSASSSSYGLKNPIPNVETQGFDTLNPYAASKAAAELICKSFGHCYGIRNVSLKYFNVYGEKSPMLGKYSPVIGLFFRQALTTAELTVVGAGEQRRDNTYVEDVVDANYKAMKILENDSKYETINNLTINIGTGKNHSVNEIAKLIIESLHKHNYAKEAFITHIDPRPAESNITLADNTLAKTLLKWQPSLTLEQGIEKIKPYFIKKYGK
jgi:UDP-glucose 4-epimerase